MIAAVGGRGGTSLLARLGALGDSLSLDAPEVHTVGSSTLVAWRRGKGHLDDEAGVAWTGRIEGHGAARRRAVDDCSGGIFGAALARDDGLLLARSLFGGRPIYYAEDRATDSVVACSRLGPLARLLRAQSAFDIERLSALVLLTEPSDEGSTAFRGIRRVLPGERILFRSDGRRTTSLAELPTVPDSCTTPGEWAEAFRSQMHAAVRRATAGVKKVGVLVSGGIDSSAILATVAAHRRLGPQDVPLAAVTLDFDAPSSDRPYLRALTDKLGICPVRVSPNDCAALALGAMVIDGVPRAWTSSAIDGQLLEVARKHDVDVLLTGIGGDFFWDPELESLAERAGSGDRAGAVRDAAKLQAVYWLPLRRQRIWGLVVRPLLRQRAPDAVWRLLQRVRSRSARAKVSWDGPKLRTFRRADTERRLTKSKRVRGREGRMLDLAHSATLASIADDFGNIEAHVGCSEEHLFMDSQLAAFMAAIPSHAVLHGGWLRGLVREAFRDEWPDIVRWRRDKGSFEPAFAELLRGLRSSGHLERLLRMEGLGDLGVVEPRSYRHAFADFERGGTVSGAAWTALWPALAVEAFLSGVS